MPAWKYTGTHPEVMPQAQNIVSEIWRYRNDHYYYDALACMRKVWLACSVTKLCNLPIGLNCIKIWVDWQRGTGVWYRPVHTMTEVDSCGRAESSRLFCPACICHQSVQHSARLHGTCQEPVMVYCLCQSHQLATHQYACHGLGSNHRQGRVSTVWLPSSQHLLV